MKLQLNNQKPPAETRKTISRTVSSMNFCGIPKETAEVLMYLKIQIETLAGILIDRQ